MDNNPVSANSVAKTYRINGSQLAKQYKNHLSKYNEWDQLEHSEQWVLYPENIGETLCLDEVALSNGELYTILTNAKAKTQKGSLIAMIKGVRSEDILKILKKIPIAENKKIKEAKKIGVKYVSPTFENGDTIKQLLARSRYLLFKPKRKWTERQSKRAEILFKEYPDIQHAYKLSMMFRNIYETAKTKRNAELAFDEWFQKIEKYNYSSFVTASESIKNHKDTILNFFVNRTTNALAESFNSKLKAFRTVFRGINDLSFFIFRVTKIFG